VVFLRDGAVQGELAAPTLDGTLEFLRGMAVPRTGPR
jgi:hypothetical protein